VEIVVLKECCKCNKLKSEENFHNRENNKKRNDCIDCVRKYGIEYRKINNELIRQKKKDYHLKNPQIKRKSYLKIQYGLTIIDYENLLKLQYYKCAICKIDHVNNSQHKHFHIDHCHKTNKIRGLLCASCNTSIGHLRDNTVFLQNAIEYLEKYKDLNV
jgi:hypothetical protein